MLMAVAGLMMTIVLAVAVLIQVLERLLPLMLVGLLVASLVVVLRLVRRQPGHHASHAAPGVLPVAVTPVAAAVVLGTTRATLPAAANDHAATYLRWGPQRCEDLDFPVANAPATPGAIDGRWT
jgi:hypothetical protein